MPAFLPLLFLLGISLIIKEHFKTGRRVSFLIAACVTGTLITFITETLSLFDALSFFPVLAVWSLLFVLTFIFALPHLKTATAGWNAFKFDRDEKIILLLIGTTVLITGLTAFVSVTNSWDSLSYHLGRVEHWIQNKTVAYYPTNIKRQLYYCPWAEYAITQLWILGGGNHPPMGCNGWLCWDP